MGDGIKRKIAKWVLNESSYFRRDVRIGKEIHKKLKVICKTYATGRKEIDTSSLKSVNNFITKNKGPDILILNTGGPPDLNFEKISDDDWIKYFNQLFLSFSKIIKDIDVKKNGYIFLISSYILNNLARNF